MPKYRVGYWTIIEAENQEEAKDYFLKNIDENSIDIEEEPETG